MPQHDSDSEKMKKYRIGDFARCMGVSASFLKHYEQSGLIDAETAANGYRYYPFNQSAHLLACIGLHNYGFSLSETKTLLYDNTAGLITEKLAQKSEEIRRRIEREEAFAEEMEWMQRWFTQVRGTGFFSEITMQEELYFLPHTSGRSFLPDERIYRLLPEWTQWMPVVKSCRRLSCQPEPSGHSDFCWGLIIPKAFAKHHHLPVNDAVTVVPARKILHFCYYLKDSASCKGTDDSLGYALRQLDSQELTVDGDYLYHIDLLRTHTAQGRERLGYYLIPVA